MAPKKAQKKKEKAELSEEDMRRLGMTDEDIQRILAGRGKSAAEKKAEQEREEARRREMEQRQKAQRELVKQLEDVVRDEGVPRVEIVAEEDKAWTAMEPEMTAEKNRVLRAFLTEQAVRKAKEAQRRQEQELAAYQESLKTMTEEEKAALHAAAVEEERQRTAELVELEEAMQRRAERREARRKARLARQAAGEPFDYNEEDSEEDEAKKGTRKTQQEVLDDMDIAMRERYER